MDPKDLEELKKLKEQKYADLEKLQELAKMSIPDFEAAEQTSPDDLSGETIKFAPVVRPTDSEKSRSASKGGQRKKKQNSKEAQRKRRKRRKWIGRIIFVLILALLIWCVVSFLNTRSKNLTRHAYYYWGMGAAITNATEEYAFDGNIISMTQYDLIGNVKAVAEFKNGNCVKELVYSDGKLVGFYTHQYNGGARTLSAYYKDNKLISAVKYTLDTVEPTKIYGEKTYYLEDNRIERLILNLDTKGNVLNETILSNDKIASVNTYSDTNIIETKIYDAEENLVQWKRFEYNPSGLPTSESVYGADNKLVSRTETEYTTIGLPTKIIRFNSDGTVRDYETYGYDQGKNPIKYVHYTGNNTIIEQISRIYNSKNQITKETGTNSAGEVTYCYGYDYDPFGNVTRKISYNNENNALMDGYTVYTRDANGLILKTEEFDTNNRLIAKSDYNTMGMIAESFRYSASNNVAEKTSYLYDDLQRMLKKAVTRFNEASHEISYIEEQFNVLGNATARIEENFVQKTYCQYLFHYAADGMLTGQSEFDRDGRKTAEKTFDVAGTVTRETVYVSGRETFTYIYSYDSGNRVIRKIVTDHLAAETKQYSYTYGMDGEVQVEQIADKDGTPLLRNEYDYNGLITTQVTYKKGEVNKTVIYTYNGLGQVQEESTFDKKGNLKSTKEYTYHEDGKVTYVEYDDEGKIIGQSKN